MTVVTVVGAQWGDEGKGKVIDFLAEKADIIARATGGNNAGHTVVVGDKTFKFHILPSGVIHEDKLSICGNGMVIDPAVLVSELNEIKSQGINVTEKTLLVSNNAHVITQQHIDRDKLEGGKIGTTGRGIGPCYEDKIARKGIRFYDYVNSDNEFSSFLKPFAHDTYDVLDSAILEGKNILMEGAQATLLDVDHGTYPFVTSSNPCASGQCTGLGIGPTSVDSVIGVSKAYCTRVGAGPFPTELGTEDQMKSEESFNELEPKLNEVLAESLEKGSNGDTYQLGKYMRLAGREYGTTTGRPRRVGWFDAVSVKYAVQINGLSSLAIMKLDVLTGLKELKICTGYKVNGKVLNCFPPDASRLEKVEVVYESFPGWSENLDLVKSFDDLPINAQNYLKKLSEYSRAPISLLSVGPERDSTICLEEIF
ncbi:Adenylosuccinate synthetase [uncultured archaeon]|nr:Adenylosuccinate synthetase [uncultured archaeon]